MIGHRLSCQHWGEIAAMRRGLAQYRSWGGTAIAASSSLVLLAFWPSHDCTNGWTNTTPSGSDVSPRWSPLFRSLLRGFGWTPPSSALMLSRTGPQWVNAPPCARAACVAVCVTAAVQFVLRIHALHAACLRAWDYGKSTPEQRRMLDKRRAPRYAKLCRATALVSYDDHFGGQCHRCAADDAVS